MPKHITTQAELNAWEEANIVSGEVWAFRRKSELLDEGFLRALHLKMFDQTWRWAGQTGLGSPFPNGNGRHARMMATSVARLGGQRFSWGQSSLTAENDNRARYLAALRPADQGSYDDLISFVRS